MFSYRGRTENEWRGKKASVQRKTLKDIQKAWRIIAQADHFKTSQETGSVEVAQTLVHCCSSSFWVDAA